MQRFAWHDLKIGHGVHVAKLRWGPVSLPLCQVRNSMAKYSAVVRPYGESNLHRSQSEFATLPHSRACEYFFPIVLNSPVRLSGTTSGLSGWKGRSLTPGYFAEAFLAPVILTRIWKMMPIG